jgi:putative tricarboxylic transport membrane protein
MTMDDKTGTGSKKNFTDWIRNQNAGLWFGLCFLAFSILFFKMSFDIPYHSKLGAGPGMYPRWLYGISIVVALIYIWQSYSVNIFKVGDYFPGKHELINVAAIFLSCLVFLFLLNHVGFIISGSLLLFFTFVRNYKLWQSIALSIGIALICYVIFKICFSVPLP